MAGAIGGGVTMHTSMAGAMLVDTGGGQCAGAYMGASSVTLAGASVAPTGMAGALSPSMLESVAT